MLKVIFVNWLWLGEKIVLQRNFYIYDINICIYLKSLNKKECFTLTGKIKCMPIYWEKLVQLDTMNVFENFYRKHEYFRLLLIYCYYIFGIWNTMFLYPWHEQRHTPLSHSLDTITLYFTHYQTFLDHLCTFYFEYLRSFYLFRCIHVSAVETMTPWHEHLIKINIQFSWMAKKKISGFEIHVEKLG